MEWKFIDHVVIRKYKCNNSQCPEKEFEVGAMAASECPYCGTRDITEITETKKRHQS